MKPLTPTTPRAIIMVGIPGAGKTAFAEHFSKTFQAPFVNEQAISRLAELSAEATSKVTSLLLSELLKTNRTLIYEGPSHTKISRTNLAKFFSAAGYQPMIVWVQTESIEAKRRATRKQKDGSQFTGEDFDASIRKFSPPTIQEKPLVISGKHTYASQLKIVLKRLASEQRPDEDVPPRVRSTRNIILR